MALAARPDAGDADQGRTVNMRPSDVDWRFKARPQAFIGVDQRREDGAHGPRMGQLARQEVTRHLRQMIVTPCIHKAISPRATIVQALVGMHARARHIVEWTRHEGAEKVVLARNRLKRHARRQDMIGRYQGMVVLKINLVLASTNFAVRRIDLNTHCR